MLKLTVGNSMVTLDKVSSSGNVFSTFVIYTNHTDDIRDMLNSFSKNEGPYMAIEGEVYNCGPTLMIEIKYKGDNDYCNVKIYNKFGAIVFDSCDNIQMVLN